MERHPYRHRPAPVIPGYRGHRHTAKHQRKSAPEVLEPVRRQRGIAHGVLDDLVAQISLHSPRIAAVIGQRKAAGMAQHVRASLKPELGRFACTLHHPSKARRREWRSAFSREHEGRLGILLYCAAAFSADHLPLR